MSSPVWADCCSSIWSCAATVVTEGVSCEVQTIIDTIVALQTEVTNFGNDITGVTSAKEQAARQWVSDEINNLQSESNKSAADLAAALSQATTIYTNERTIIEYKATSANTQNLQATSPTSVSGPPHTEIAQITSEKTPSGAPRSMMAQRSQEITPAPVSGNPMLQKSTISTAPQISPSAELVAAPHGSYSQEFSRAVKQLAALKGNGDAALSKINQSLTQAQSSEGPGVAAADTIAGAMSSPVKAIASKLSEMLDHPLDAFDPTSAVDDMETTITAAMDSNIPKMIADITTGPDQACDAGKLSYYILRENAQYAVAIAAAMDRLYKQRTPGAAIALDQLLPKVDYAGLTSKSTAQAVANVGQQQAYAIDTANYAAAKKKLLVVDHPPRLAKIHTLIAQFKAQRAQGKASLPQAMLMTYKATFSGQLNSYFNNKSPAAIAAQRDQLIAQARTQFAKNPTTENGVIGLINSEAQKQGAAMTAAVPGQRIPTMSTGAAANNASPAVAVMTSPAATAPPAAMTSAKPQTGLVPGATPSALSTKALFVIPVAVPAAPSSAAPATMAPNQPKVATWGTPSAWTPPPAAAASTPAMTSGAPVVPHTVTVIKPATALKTSQPVQRPVEQPPSGPPAPSTTTSAPQACNKVGNKLPCVCVTGSTKNPAGCMVTGWDLNKNRAS
jgi:hypothetical protein